MGFFSAIVAHISNIEKMLTMMTTSLTASSRFDLYRSLNQTKYIVFRSIMEEIKRYLFECSSFMFSFLLNANR